MNKHPKNGIGTNSTVKKRKYIVGSRKLTVISLAIVSVILVSYVSLIYYPESVQNSAYAASDEKAYSVDAKLVSANTKFAFNLFRELVAEEMNKNIFISPLSISIALTMTYNGAEDTTKEAMAALSLNSYFSEDVQVISNYFGHQFFPLMVSSNG